MTKVFFQRFTIPVIHYVNPTAKQVQTELILLDFGGEILISYLLIP